MHLTGRLGMRYRRHYRKGGCYFFTAVSYRRQKIFCTDASNKVLRKAFQRVRQKHPFKINAIVVLPDHIHCLWTLPVGDQDFSSRWRLIKYHFTRNYQHQVINPNNPVWQNRYWEHLIRDSEDFQRHVEYIHYNPVKHDFVSAPRDWPWSSFHRYVKQGIYPVSWGSHKTEIPEDTGNE